jgi:hypothetical protein
MVGAVALGEAFAGIFEYRGYSGTVLDAPVFLGPILVALVLGVFVGVRFSRSHASYWVWIAGLLNFIVAVLDWKTSISIGDWRPIWYNFFTRNCGDSECIYELTATAPLYTSLTYSLAVALCYGWRFHRKMS